MQNPYMQGAPHPQNPSVYVQQMAPQMPLHSSVQQQQNPYSMQGNEMSQMQQMAQQQQPSYGSSLNQMQQMPPHLQQSASDQQLQQQNMLRFARPSSMQQQPVVHQVQDTSGPSNVVPMETLPSRSNVEEQNAQQQQQQQQQQQSAEPAKSQAANLAEHQQQQLQQNQESLLFKNLDQKSPLVLCTLGKDVTREIVNQSVEFFKNCKGLQLPYQQLMPGQTMSMIKTNMEKQDKIGKSITIMFERLFEISSKIDGHYKALIPANASVQDLIPYADTENETLKALKEKTSNEEYKRLKQEHQETKELLQQKQKELKDVMDFLISVSWDTSNVLNHMNV